MTKIFSHRAQKIKSSAIREILKITEQPDVISFAGGLPSPNTFPTDEMQNAFQALCDTDQLQAALQYGPTEGYRPLRQWIAKYISQRDQIAIDENQVLIVSGSQQSLDLVGKMLIDEGSQVLVESPTYLGGLQSFSQYEPTFYSIESDDQGLVPTAISASLAQNAAFIYTIPNFQNPTGRRLPLARRQQLAELAKTHDLLMVEDDPYGDLDYVGQRVPTLFSLTPEHTIYLGSFSKILAPGLRLGFVIASENVIHKLVQIKQATDLHTSSLTQYLAYQVLKTGFLPQQIQKIQQLYAERCQCLIRALTQNMPEGVTWHQPEGGMFVWVALPETIDTNQLLADAISQKVAFVPGDTFFATDAKNHYLRLSFVTVSQEKIEKGIKILADLICQKMTH